MISKSKGVRINVEEDFFKNLFEPSRRELERELGVRVTQRQLTSMIFKSGIKFKPKLLRFAKNATKKNSRKKR